MKNKLFIIYSFLILLLLNISTYSSNETDIQNKKYALLINGDTSYLHLSNMEKMYKLLINIGYEDNNIFILNPKNIRNRTCTELINNQRANLESISTVSSYLKNLITDKDLLFIYITGHGDQDQEKVQSRIVLERNMRINQKDFDKYIKQIPFNLLIVVIDCCFSGGIISELTLDQSRNVIGISSTDAAHSTYCKYFLEGFINSFYNKDADTNDDNKISISEAYNLAVKEHKLNLSHRSIETNTKYLFSGIFNDFILGDVIQGDEINSELE